MHFFKKYSLFVLCASIAALPVSAHAMGSKNNNTAQAQTVSTEDITSRIIERVFTDLERDLILDYYGGVKKKDLPPGLAKKDRLPPGLEKQLQRNGRLPPGLEKRSLPPSLERDLPVRDDKIVRRVIGSDVVLIDEATDMVLDIIRHVIE